jgi:predicted patatin/cPLA2 family phospholipase
MRDLAIICGDGGLRGAFIAGALSQLIAEFPDHFERMSGIYACSASVGSVCYYLSHAHKHPGREIWTKRIPNSLFLNYKGFGSLVAAEPVYDIDHLVDDIFLKENPLDETRIFNSPIKVVFPLYNVDLGCVEYFTNDRLLTLGSDKFKDMTKYSIYQIIKAAIAAPIIYDRAIIVDGARYCDPGIVEPFVCQIPGITARKNLIIVSSMGMSFSGCAAFVFIGLAWYVMSLMTERAHLTARTYLGVARKPFILQKVAKQIEAQSNTLIIAPPSPLRSAFDDSQESMSYNFWLGESYVNINRDRLYRFIYEA